MTNNGDVQPGFGIFMDDTRNIPESIYPVKVEEKGSAFTNNHISVIVKNKCGGSFNHEPSNIIECVQNECYNSIVSSKINMQEYTTLDNDNMNNTKISEDKDESDRSENEEDNGGKCFDIET